MINFWTTETTNTLLNKSGDHPLDLIFCSGEHPQFSSRAEVFKDALARRIFDRARLIKFMLDDMTEEWGSPDWPKIGACARVLTTILSTPAPRMVALNLIYTFDFERMPEHYKPAPSINLCHRDMSSADYASLRILKLDSWITIAPDDIFYRPPLVSLTLSRGVYFDTIGEFLDVLARLPTLRSLKLYNEDDDIFEREDPFGEDPMKEAALRYGREPGSVALPSLELFKFGVSRLALIVDIMRWVSLPRSTRLVFTRVLYHRDMPEISPRSIQEEVVGLCDTLKNHLNSQERKGDPTFCGLGGLVATAEGPWVDEGRSTCTFRIRAHSLYPPDARTTPLIDISLNYYMGFLYDNIMLEFAKRLPFIHGNESTRLALTLVDAPSNTPPPSRTIIYSADVDEPAAAMHSSWLSACDVLKSAGTVSSFSPASNDTIMPNLAILDLHGPIPLPTHHLFEVYVENIAGPLCPRIQAGTLREVNISSDGPMYRESIRVLNERLGGVVRWQGTLV
ncbi:unnamed protein product [Peniophora sp. CBMAI 1063]|nr:unnamed protein product [Peniophora sp. CBMAI 1063]